MLTYKYILYIILCSIAAPTGGAFLYMGVHLLRVGEVKSLHSPLQL